MRAVRYHDHGGPEVLGVDEVDRPEPDDDQVLVEMRAASVNPVDVMIRSGEYGKVPLPSVPGGDGAGVVATTGDDVDRFREGDRVIASGMDRESGGTFAEYAALPETKLAQLPDEVPFEVGGAIGNVGATAWTALEAVAGVSPGDRVLVHGGAGGVGHAAVQIAAAGGADVIATAGSADACDRVRELGASTALQYDSDTLAEDVLAATTDSKRISISTWRWSPRAGRSSPSWATSRRRTPSPSTARKSPCGRSGWTTIRSERLSWSDSVVCYGAAT
mgnify:CR=1 FL=1